jgi:predicted DNA-binding transcriptional regulator YafY
MRADRLVAILLLLQTHGQLTAADLAERLETSERTMRRDLDALSAAGVPVYSQRGRGGGWALLGGHRLNLSGLTAAEAEALFLVAGPERLAGLGVEPGVRSALRKLLAALPAPLRDQATAARAAVHVDPVRWGRKAEPQSRHVDALREAVVAGVQVDLSYAKPGQAPTGRRVHPFGLVSKSGTWYLIAGTAEGLRTFRVSRVRSVSRTDEAVERPEDFDLAQAWEAVVEQIPQRTDGLAVDLRVAPEVLGWIRASLSGWARLTLLDPPHEQDGTGWTQFRATFPNASAAAANLASFGARVEVLSPPEVRHELARIARELAEIYGATTG